MKRISYLFFLIFITSILASSCSSTETYAQLLNDESTLIHNFIVRNNIQIINSFPADSIWVKNGKDLYVQTSSGLFYHLINPGVSITPDDTLMLKNTVVPRFVQYSLGIPSDTVSNWSTIDYPYPSDFVFGDLTQSCKGFQEAVSYMKRNYSEAKIIVPSKIGFNANMMSVTPLGYDIKIQILK